MSDAGSNNFVRFQRPMFPPSDRIDHYFAPARERGWYSNGGPCLEQLTERLEARTECSCILVASGTAGLLVAVHALSGHSEKTEALVPSFTFAATAQALAWNGLEPVFVDVDAEHLHLSPAALDEALNARADRVCLVLAGSAFGTPPPPAVRQAWEESCRRARVPLLVDSAAGFGSAAEDGVPIGAQGDAEVVSFHITKPFGIGEGGAIFTRDRDLAARLRRLINFSFDDQRQASTLRGLNAKLDELHAAVGLAVLDTFDDHLHRRRRIAGQLLDELGPSFRGQAGHSLGTYQLLPVVVDNEGVRRRIMEAAEGRVELRTYYDPLHLMPAFDRVPKPDGLATTEDLGRRILSLPMGVDLNERELRTIVDVCRQGTDE